MNSAKRRAEIVGNLAFVRERIVVAADSVGRDPQEVKLIVVTKNFPLSDCQILYELGIRDFGENRDQEGLSKSAQLPKDLLWHFQGQIQSRKIRSIAGWADSVHSLDSLEHAQKFTALPERRTRNFFIQINLEPHRLDRGGTAPEELERLLVGLEEEVALQPAGLMTVAPLGSPPNLAFSKLQELQERFISDFPSLKSLSMGMSGDFEVAIRAGATHLRIGSSILGSRPLPA